MMQSKQLLEKLTGRCVRYFAYPGGEYDRNSLQVLETSGFEAAFATNQRRVNLNRRFEITRVGIYSTSFPKFWLKAHGVMKPNLRFRTKTTRASRRAETVPLS
jgi:peptidoglycan/xylan/chitin deacetylase (PgdA/CDA1 family)